MASTENIVRVRGIPWEVVRKLGLPRKEWTQDWFCLLPGTASDQAQERENVLNSEWGQFRHGRSSQVGLLVKPLVREPWPVLSLGCQWKANCFPLYTSYFPGRSYLLNTTHKFQMKARHLFPVMWLSQTLHTPIYSNIGQPCKRLHCVQ